MYILGVNSAYHEPSACLIKEGQIVAAVEEERFTRIRHGKPANLKNPHEIPENSIRYCLDAAGIQMRDVDHIGYSFLPEKRRAYNLGLGEEVTGGCAGSPEREQRFFDLLQSVPEVLGSRFNDNLRDRFLWLEHHLCHASSTFYLSPCEQAAILSIDGIGEAACTWFGRGDGNRMVALREVTFPNSVGLLWAKMSRFLGFGEYGQWKVMGLAGYGHAERYYAALREVVDFDEQGSFSIDPQVFQLRVNRFDGLEKLFGPDRSPGAPVEGRHQDVAAALQKLTTEVFLSFASYLHGETRLNHLCLAGGVALNCVANRALVEDGPFDGVFIQPAANDGGTALGACYYIWNQLLDQPRGPGLAHVFLGPEFSQADGLAALAGRDYSTIPEQNPGGISAMVARLLAQGEIVAWCQGRMEFGPRALGNRSILADPRRSDIIYTLNGKVKHREYFRPLAGSVLTERADEWFVLDRLTPSDAFMVTARLVREDKRGIIPAVTHVDNTCRIQRVDRETNPRFHELLTEFEELTGVPIVLNTSFNDREPIICTPQNAVATCLKSGIRYLVLGNELIDFGAPDLSAESDSTPFSIPSTCGSPVSEFPR
jgi:carbamoyltransferase